MDTPWQQFDFSGHENQLDAYGDSSAQQMMHNREIHTFSNGYSHDLDGNAEEEAGETIECTREQADPSIDSTFQMTFGPPSSSRGISSGQITQEWKYLVTPEEWLTHAETYLRSGQSRLMLQPLDMSCSFSVSDAHAWDLPLIYCSPAFERKTQYPLDHVRGINHRFMQDPHGSQPAGVSRKFSDNEAIAEMFSKLSIGQESQVSVRNYTRAGQSWQNLLTMVPISVANSGSVDFVIGLQIDSNSHPENLLNFLPNGLRCVDYRTLQATSVQWPASLRGGSPTAADSGLQIVDQTSLIPDGIAKTWSSFLLNHMDDAIFVLSQSGMVLYVSPGVLSVLGCPSQALLGKNISSCMHPSDLPNLLSGFCSAQANGSHTVLVRMRRIDGKYYWVEFSGQQRLDDANEPSEHLVLSARLRPPFSFSTSDTVSSGEFWTRISTEGMILFTTAAASRFAGLHRAQLLGAKFTTLLEESDVDTFYQVLAVARAGIPGRFKHVCVEKRHGKRFSMLSDIYPGVAGESVQTSVLVRTRLASSDERKSKTSLDTIHLDKSGKMLSLAPSSFADISAQFEPNNKADWHDDYQKTKLINLKLRERLQHLKSQASIGTSQKSSKKVAHNNAQERALVND